MSVKILQLRKTGSFLQNSFLCIMNDNHYMLRNDKLEIDLTLVFDICENNKTDIEKFITTFLNSTNITIGKFDKYLLEKDLEGLYNTAHSARSSLSIIRVKGMYDLILLIEQSVKETNNFEHLNPLITAAKQQYLDVQQLLNERVNLNIQFNKI